MCKKNKIQSSNKDLMNKHLNQTDKNTLCSPRKIKTPALQMTASTLVQPHEPAPQKHFCHLPISPSYIQWSPRPAITQISLNLSPPSHILGRAPDPLTSSHLDSFLSE